VKLGLVFVSSIALVALASEAGAAGRPPGVPEDYVLTHHGFFHPSCVVPVASGDFVGEDLVVRGEDGTEHGRLTPCPYPRFTLAGQLVDEHPHDTWDGWLVYYEDDGKSPIPVAPTLTSEWVVPPMPTLAEGQDVAFFNGIKTTAGGGDILQPVLDFSEVPGTWVIFSEHCCLGGHDLQTMPPIPVSPGDVVRGVVAGRGCRSDGVCENWSVTTTDVTTGQSTVLNTAAPMGVPEKVNPGVLETYNLSSCDMLPPSGEETFTRNELQDGDGHLQQLDFVLHVPSARAADVPSCGYRGQSKSDTYQLVFGGAAGSAEPDFGAPAGCQCESMGAALPHDRQIPATLVALFLVLLVRRNAGLG